MIAGDPGGKEDKMKKKDTVIGQLAKTYQQLYLDPDKDSKESYREIVLKGKDAPEPSLSGYHLDPGDREELCETPAGPVRIITICDREDFERVIRNMMAAREGPEQKVPRSQGAATLQVFNWERIREHKNRFMDESLRKGIVSPDWGAEMKRFTSVKENYIDHLILLSIGPYSNLSAENAGFGEEEWIALSDTIRKYHEITHVVCRRLYPEKISPLWDELAADAIGLYAAFGDYDRDLAGKLLGIRGEHYTGGRLENYTEDPEKIAPEVERVLDGIHEIIKKEKGIDAFSMIDILESDPLSRSLQCS